jgi:hypothetical protein
MTASLRFRIAGREDTPAIVALLNQSFRARIDTATWDWFSYENPYGESRVYLAEEPDSAAVAGVFSFTPVPMRLHGEAIPVTHGHHLVVAPAHRGGPSFVALSRYALEAEASRGIRFVIGLLNRKSYQPHKFLMKWSDFGFLECLYKEFSISREHRCREVSAFPEDFDAFYRRVSESLPLHCDKTREWMDWRFFRRPGAPYTVYIATRNGAMTGYVVLKRWRDPDGYSKAHIIDLHALNEEVLVELVSAAESYAAGSNELNLWAAQGYRYRGFLESTGFCSRDASAPQPLAARALNGCSVMFPEGPTSFSYGDGDSLY